MTITAISATRDTINAIRDGVNLSLPKSLLNFDYIELMGIKDIALDLRDGVYNAFPVVEKVGYYVEQNLATQPETFSHGDWLKTRCTISPNAIAAPDGTMTADKLVEDATASSTHQVSQSHNYVSAKPYTYSIIAKAAERTKIEIRFTGAAAFASNQAVTFDLTNGTAAISSGSPRYRIKHIGNGFYRCSVTAVATGTGIGTQTFRLHDGAGTSYTGDNVSGLYIWAAKDNEGTAPGVYTSVSGWKDDSLPLPIVGIYSSGAGHGNSDRQIMVRSDDNGETYIKRDFFVNATATYDATLLDGLLATGDKLVFKVFTIEKTSGGYSCTSVSSVVNGGVTYALWSQTIKIGTTLYRTGYSTSGGVTQSALFSSADGGVTWAFVSVICAEAGVNYSEAALVQCSGGSIFCIIRKDGFNSTRPLVWVRSSDFVTWSAPVQFDPAFINGTQPVLLRLKNNKLLLMTGDRVGNSGLTSIGRNFSGQAITGIAAWISTDELGTAWTERYMLAPMWSTDGGQPAPVELADGRIVHLYYAAPAATNSNSGIEPGVFTGTFNALQLK